MQGDKNLVDLKKGERKKKRKKEQGRARQWERIDFPSCTFTEGFSETILMDIWVRKASTENSFQGFGKQMICSKDTHPFLGKQSEADLPSDQWKVSYRLCIFANQLELHPLWV